ncbi:MAG: phosphoribosylformylglycinamidine synthase [Clostridiales bacterium]|jgi:phosphoribosylformylglycinamidine synthase|nr:phosphoribosylformylglycinamidine synthase [Clostridiales bacterium]
MIKRIFVEKKPGFDAEAARMAEDLRVSLNLPGIVGLKIVNIYDIDGLDEDMCEIVKGSILSELPVDLVFEEDYEAGGGFRFAVKYLPGQYDQRADSAMQCIQIAIGGKASGVRVESARLFVIEGELSEADKARIESYCINSVDSMKAPLEKPESLGVPFKEPPDIKTEEGFIKLSEEEVKSLAEEMGLAMSGEDLNHCRLHFIEENRDPTFTEIKVIDTYWSDHCRHTTFLTRIENAEIEGGLYAEPIKEAFALFKKENASKGQGGFCLMDVATAGMKALKRQGLVPDLDESDEINACSIAVEAEVDGQRQEWLVMFKNETHNHPTEIEPFGGAATCLGGAIRDPLSGRSYVYHAMRVTGSGDPRKPVSETIPGKLPQRKITAEAARGFSSYGNQIGLATGQVFEIYDEGYAAKRMEIGAVVGAAPKAHVKRSAPAPGDCVILVGGRTGRDGCGGATGSSKEHDENSILKCGAEVQKGNPPTERKLQRLFRNPDASGLIKRCNDFGAGGVAVAIGELADGLDINLDLVPKKYEGLDGTELAISESQERMAAVVAAEGAEAFIQLANAENLEATEVAKVTEEKRLIMRWRGAVIVDLPRSFLNTNGASQSASAIIKAPDEKRDSPSSDPSKWLDNLKDLANASQKGLAERFDSTIGAGTVLMPFGGKHQLTPIEAMAAKLPVQDGETSAATCMSFGCDPAAARWSPFHASVYAVVEAAAKLAATGCDYRRIRLSLQEYFEKMTKDPLKWGKPLSALLGAFYAQMNLGIPAIGGKDSMSGTFKELHVPPTLVAFALCPADAKAIASPEFKAAGHLIARINARYDEKGMPDFEHLKLIFSAIYEMAANGAILAASSVGKGGAAASISKMALGNGIGADITDKDLYSARYGSFIIETGLSEKDLRKRFPCMDLTVIGKTKHEKSICANGLSMSLQSVLESWMSLEGVFPTQWLKKEFFSPETGDASLELPLFEGAASAPKRGLASPRIFIPVFPGTNCEYDTTRAFEKAGGKVSSLVIRNLNQRWLDETVEEMARLIKQSQIIAIPGGFSAGDEPEGSGKFIAAVFRNPAIKDAVDELLKNRDGLILGICNGFQALVKLGLIQHGEIRAQSVNSATLACNTIARHVSCMVRTRVVSTASPWFWETRPGEEFVIPVSHGEGRFAASPEAVAKLIERNQIAAQYVGLDGKPTYDIRYNPNGSMYAIEAASSPDGRILGKMGHSERAGEGLYKNIDGNKCQNIFQAGINYFM